MTRQLSLAIAESAESLEQQLKTSRTEAPERTIAFVVVAENWTNHST